MNSSNQFFSFIYTKYFRIQQYFYLNKENDNLLKNYRKLLFFLLNKYPDYQKQKYSDSLFIIQPAEIIQKTVNLRNNFFTINKGKDDGIDPEDAIISANGIVGIITNVSKNYAAGLLIINQINGFSAKLKKNNYFGSLTWDGKDYRYMILSEIPNHIKVDIGDTIVTSGYDIVFPPNYPIGIVSQIKKNSQDNFYTIKVKLFEDLKKTTKVFVVKYKNKKQLEELQKQIKNIIDYNLRLK